jgi:hypothetical protein
MRDLVSLFAPISIAASADHDRYLLAHTRCTRSLNSGHQTFMAPSATRSMPVT